MKKLLLTLLISILFATNINVVDAQELETEITASLATDAASLASSSALENLQIEKLKKGDITQPEEFQEKEEILSLFRQRTVDTLNITNFIPFTIQYAVKAGVPANTVILILLLPFLATFMAIVRHVIGLPSMEMLVPIVLAVTLIATGITAGLILLVTILTGSICSRIILKKIRIMQLPKMALSLMLVSIFVFIVLLISAANGILVVRQLSIFPILIFIILSDKIVAVQMERSLRETLIITSTTICLGILGYMFLASEEIRNFVLLYPEIILLLIPVNILIGRYFGLRLTEMYRFSSIKSYGNQ